MNFLELEILAEKCRNWMYPLLLNDTEDYNRVKGENPEVETTFLSIPTVVAPRGGFVDRVGGLFVAKSGRMAVNSALRQRGRENDPHQAYTVIAEKSLEACTNVNAGCILLAFHEYGHAWDYILHGWNATRVYSGSGAEARAISRELLCMRKALEDGFAQQHGVKKSDVATAIADMNRKIAAYNKFQDQTNTAIMNNQLRLLESYCSD